MVTNLLDRKILTAWLNAAENPIWVVKPKFKEAYPFDREAAVVKVGTKYTLINKAGHAFTHL